MLEPFGDLRPYLVQVLDPLSGKVIGTGFVCHPEGFVLTCWHVMEPWHQKSWTKINVQFDGKAAEAEWLIEKSDQIADLAVLRLAIPDIHKTPYLPLDVYWRVRVEDPLESFGYPIGQFSKPGISITARFGGLTSTQTNGIEVFPIKDLNLDNINSGYSGAPVLNRATDKVIGLVHAKHHENQAFIVPLTALFAQWPELRTFHDVFKQICQRLGQVAQGRLEERLHGAPFISPNLEVGAIPKPEEGLTRSKPGDDSGTYAHGRRWEAFSLKQLLPPRKPFVLSSDVGTGKSVFLDWLAVELVNKTRTVPIVMTCETLERRNPHTLNDIVRIGVEQLWNEFSHLDLEAFVTETDQKGEPVFLFDGLDQIGSGKPSTLVTQVLSAVGRYPVLITSRPSAVLTFENDAKLDFLRLQAFSAKDQRTYFGAHYAKSQTVCSTAPDLARVPMLAYMVRALIVVEKSAESLTRTELYERFIKYILSTHEPNRPISLESPDLAQDVQHELQRLAYIALAADTPSIQKVPMSVYPKDARVKIAELPTFGLLNRIVDQGEQALFFTHQSFQEFLAAKFAAAHPECVDKILTERWNPKWAEVILFLAGLQGEVLVWRVLNEPDNVIHSNLFLAARCAGETKTLSPDIKAKLIERLLKLSKVNPFQEAARRALNTIGRKLEKAQIQWLIGQLRDANANVRSAAIEALGGLGDRLDAPTISIIVRMLRDTNWRVRLSAVEALGTLGDRLEGATVSALVGMLRDNNANVCRVAVEALGTLGDRLEGATVSTLVEMLRDNNAHVRRGAVTILGTFGDRLKGSTVSALVGMLCDTHPYVLQAVIEALGRLGNSFEGPIVISALVGLLRDADKRVCAGACWSLVELSDHLDDRTVSALIEMLRDTDESVRWAAGKVLGRLGNRLEGSTVCVLVEMLRDTDESVRWAAIEALLNLGDRLEGSMVSTVVGMLRDPDENVRFAAIAVLEKLGDHLEGSTVNALVRMLHDTNWKVRRAAIEALVELGDRLEVPTVSAIIGMLSDVNADVRWVAIEGLGRLKDRLEDRTVSAIVGMLRDTKVRWAVVRFLGELGDRLESPMVNALVEMLRDTDPYVREDAIEALGKLGDRLEGSIVCVFVEMLRDTNKSVRGAAIEALVELGDRLEGPMVSAIVGMLRDTNWNVRRAAVEVLGRLEDCLEGPTVSALVGTLSDANADVREAAIEVLGNLGGHLDGRTIFKLAEMLARKKDAYKVYGTLENLYRAGVALPTLTKSKPSRKKRPKKIGDA